MCWVTGFKTLGTIMIAPTIVIAVVITWKSREVVAELCHNLAVVFWISANSTWMIGEFFYNDTTRPYAIAFFSAGFISLGYYYIVRAPFWRTKT